jgi:hypothetical protein
VRPRCDREGRGGCGEPRHGVALPAMTSTVAAAGTMSCSSPAQGWLLMPAAKAAGESGLHSTSQPRSPARSTGPWWAAGVIPGIPVPRGGPARRRRRMAIAAKIVAPSVRRYLRAARPGSRRVRVSRVMSAPGGPAMRPDRL